MTNLFAISSSRLTLLLLLALIALSGWSIYLTRPPQAKPATAPRAEFSAERAMTHVQQIAREPHAMGTPGHVRARTYLLGALRGLGLDPQVQEGTAVSRPTNPTSPVPSGALFALAARVGYAYNVMARIQGQETGKAGGPAFRPRKAVMLVAHYDSQPNTPGAGDNGAGVAAVLEAARAIRESPPLQHDVILLFTDGEEYGLFGALTFLRHSWAKDVGFILNLDARGNRGASLLFETSAENGWIVEQMAQAAPHPRATSLMYAVYQKLPNFTDFSAFREAGYAGINAGLLDGFVHYHKLTDSPENLSLGSLQHHGNNLLALARHVANGPLDRLTAPDKVYFNGAGDWLIHYPMALDWLWMGLLTVLLGASLALGFRQGQLTGWQVLGGLGLHLLMLLLTAGFCFVVTLGIYRALPLTHALVNGTYGTAQFFVAYSLLTVGALGLLTRLACRWLRPLSLVLGGYVLVYAVTAGLFAWLPGGTYLLLFPLLGMLAGLTLVLSQTRRWVAGQPAYALLIAALPTVFIVIPTVNQLFITFDLQLPVAPMLLLGLTFALLLPLWLLIETGLRWKKWATLPLVSFVLGGIVTLWAIRNEAPSAQQPLHSQVSYYLNADREQAVWASYWLLETDPWNQQFFPKPSVGPLTEMAPAFQSVARRVYLKNPAPALTDAPPVAERVADQTVGPVRQLTLNLRSPRGAAHLEVALFPSRPEQVRGVWVNGERVELKAQPADGGPAFDLLFFGLPVSKQISMRIDLTAGSPLRLRLYDQSIGLPTKLVKQPKPPYVIPEQGRVSNLTVIGKMYQF